MGIVTTVLNIKRHKPVQDVTFPNRYEELAGEGGRVAGIKGR